MATYPKILKPARTYPSANVIMGINFHYKADNPDPTLGAVGLTPGVAKHIGTIPAGSIVLNGFKHTVSVPNGTTPTLEIGTGPSVNAAGAAVPADPDAFATSAVLMATGVNGQVVGALNGLVTQDTPVFALLGGTGTTTGEVVVVLQFYTQKD
jgi:hypothetical protein